MATINTKYNPSDVVWFMNCNRPVNDAICKVRVDLSLGDVTEVHYVLRNHKGRAEELLFKTKQELINSL